MTYEYYMNEEPELLKIIDEELESLKIMDEEPESLKIMNEELESLKTMTEEEICEKYNLDSADEAEMCIRDYWSFMA